MLSLSRHFLENWEERVSEMMPTADVIKDIIAESVIVQKCRNLQRPDGSLFRQLAIYWNPKRNIVLKVDEFRGVVVTVLSPKNGKGSEKNEPGDREDT